MDQLRRPVRRGVIEIRPVVLLAELHYRVAVERSLRLLRVLPDVLSRYLVIVQLDELHGVDDGGGEVLPLRPRGRRVVQPCLVILRHVALLRVYDVDDVGRQLVLLAGDGDELLHLVRRRRAVVLDRIVTAYLEKLAEVFRVEEVRLYLERELRVGERVMIYNRLCLLVHPVCNLTEYIIKDVSGFFVPAAAGR